MARPALRRLNGHDLVVLNALQRPKPEPLCHCGRGQGNGARQLQEQERNGNSKETVEKPRLPVVGRHKNDVDHEGGQREDSCPENDRLSAKDEAVGSLADRAFGQTAAENEKNQETKSDAADQIRMYVHREALMDGLMDYVVNLLYRRRRIVW